MMIILLILHHLLLNFITFNIILMMLFLFIKLRHILIIMDLIIHILRNFYHLFIKLKLYYYSEIIIYGYVYPITL